MLHVGFFLVWSSILKMEAICSSETSANFQQTTWCYSPKDRTLRTINLLSLPFHRSTVRSSHK
jgi:hypothetical protein